MVTHSSVLVWRIPWTEEPGRVTGYSPWYHKELDTTEATEHTGIWVKSIGEYFEKCG